MKVLISIDERLLRRVDAAARRRGVTRSAYLSALAERDIGAAIGPGRDPAVRSALQRLDALFAKPGRREESTAAIRASRDSR